MPRSTATQRDVASNTAALERALKALALEDEHAGLVQLARSLAATLDGGGTADGNLVREYRQVLDMLAKAGAGGRDDGEQAFLVSVQTPGVRAPVRNTKKR